MSFSALESAICSSVSHLQREETSLSRASTASPPNWFPPLNVHVPKDERESVT
jgi:hypothetical protein